MVWARFSIFKIWMLRGLYGGRFLSPTLSNYHLLLLGVLRASWKSIFACVPCLYDIYIKLSSCSFPTVSLCP